MTSHTKESLIAFENRIKALFEAGELPFLLHLCGGNESQLLEVFSDVKPGDWIFSTHRSHYHYLLAGGSEDRLEELIRDGRSMFVFDRALNFLTSSVLAGTCGIAAGVALGLKRQGSGNRVWCFLGDGAEEEGHFYEGALFVEANDLPCTFVIEDNSRQVDTPKIERRGDNYAVNRPLDHFECVRRYHYDPTYPHAGRGPGPTVTFKPEVVARFSADSKFDTLSQTLP